MLSILMFMFLLFLIYCAYEYIKGFRNGLAKDGMTFLDLMVMRRQWIANGRPRPDKEGLAQRLQRVNEIGNFAEAVARLQAANTYNARLRLALLAEQYQIGLQQIEAMREATPTSEAEFSIVEAEFHALAEEAAWEITGLAVDFRQNLPQLISAYSGRKGELRAARRQLRL